MSLKSILAQARTIAIAVLLSFGVLVGCVNASEVSQADEPTVVTSA